MKNHPYEFLLGIISINCIIKQIGKTIILVKIQTPNESIKERVKREGKIKESFRSPITRLNERKISLRS
jgi:hypothetical protein